MSESEKNWAIQNQIRLLKIGQKEIKDQSKILQNLYHFYEELFSKDVSSSNEVTEHYLKNISLPKLIKEQDEQCEGEITKNEVKDALGNMTCNKAPENNDHISELYKAFGSELKSHLLISYKKTFLSVESKISRKQAVIKLIEKKEDRDKRFTKNWRPISLLNIDVKLISKVLAKGIKKQLPWLISSNKTA